MAHDKAVVLNRFWAGVISAVMIAGIIGASGTALSAYAQMAVMREDVKQLKDAKLEPKVIAIEQQMKYTAQTVTRIEAEQAKISEKLDQLIGRRGR